MCNAQNEAFCVCTYVLVKVYVAVAWILQLIFLKALLNYEVEGQIIECR